MKLEGGNRKSWDGSDQNTEYEIDKKISKSIYYKNQTVILIIVVEQQPQKRTLRGSLKSDFLNLIPLEF